MKDRFKFRAWQHGGMLTMPIDNNFGLSRLIGYVNDDSPLMQCTGLKDKTGKLIFEGDICKPVGVGMSHFKIGAVSLDTNLNHHVWLPNGKSVNYTDGSDWEVIGSIHENPELLEK